MRIGLFTDTYPPFINGVSTSVLMLKQGLEKLGHEVYVVTVNDESFSYKEEDGILKIPSFPIGLMNFRQTGIYPIKAFNIIKKWKLDIIHSHTEFSIGTFARLISKQLNIPLVHTYHTMYEEYIYYITKGYFNSASKKLVEYLTLFLCDKTIDELIVPTEKTNEIMDKDGWLYTGDLAKYYDKENISIVGRCKDMVIRGGYNVYPSDIEEIILRIPEVQTAAVVGRPHDVLGEELVAFVVLRAGEEIKKSDINRYIFQNLANYKLPDQIYLISDMPAILAGKIDKKVLRDWAVNGIPQDKQMMFSE